MVAVLSRLVGGTDTHCVALAVETCAIEITLGEVVGGGDEVGESVLHVGAYALHVVEIAMGDG